MNKNTETAQQLDIQYILSVVYRKKKYFIIPAVVCMFAGLIMAFILPKEYEAYSTVLMHNKRVVDPLMPHAAASYDFKTELKTLSKQVLSWPRMEQLVKELDLIKGDASAVELEEFIEALQKRITVDMKGGELIEVKYRDKSPEMAQKITNLVTKNFLDESTRQKREDAQGTIDFINEQLVIYRKKLEDSGKDFSTSKVDSDLRIASNKMNLLLDKRTKIQRYVQQSITKEKSPVIYQLQKQMSELQAELGRLLLDAKEGNPRVSELRKNISEISASIKKEQDKETLKESVSITNPEYLKVEQEIKQLEMDIEYLRKRKKELSSSGRDANEPISEEKLSTLQHSKDVDEDIYQMLLKQLEAAYVSERFQDSDKVSKFSIIEYARVPLSPVKPSKKKLVILGFLAGCAIGAGIIFAMEFINDSFKTVEDAKKFLPVSFLGTISRMVMAEEGKLSMKKKLKLRLKKLSHKVKFLSFLDFVEPHAVRKLKSSAYSPFLVSYHEPYTRNANEFRVVRFKMLDLMADKKSKIAAITSVGKGEGKSTTSSNLAVSIAKDGKKVLLVDCDLRKGSLHEIFGMQNGAGFIQAVKNINSVNDFIRPTEVDKLKIMLSGGSVNDPSEFLDSAGVKNLFDVVSDQFDVVIVDTPPVSNLPDTYMVGKLSGCVVLVVQMHKTQKTDIQNVYNDLIKAKIDVCGLILTDTQCTVPLYLNDYYYYGYV